ncbi:hypothetical protein [Oceanobacillus halotolerans]|uniref:hypothetical protein n=1 Tax=Oceanobacillus halotolerans TaxID=2663380 RepID=UPI0013DD533F|nr:hypothetical protein [Oceanobacillus halotolerans]
MKRQKRGINYMVLILSVIIIAGVSTMIFLLTSPEHQAKKAVDTFYAYEQEGAFSESYTMFHPYMKEKFDKGHYLQDRAHVFLNHFDVETFSYSLGDASKVTNWKMEENTESIGTVYHIPVSQVFKGKYGNFTIVQDVYAAKEGGEWTILWDYKK